MDECKPGPSRDRCKSLESRNSEVHPDEQEEIIKIWKDTDEKLEMYAKKHKLTAVNVKSILRHLIKNPPELAVLLGMPSSELQPDGGRVTRSKLQPNRKKVDLAPIHIGRPTFLDVEYDDNDEFDIDYEPSNDSEEDEEEEEEEMEENEGDADLCSELVVGSLAVDEDCLLHLDCRLNCAASSSVMLPRFPARGEEEDDFGLPLHSKRNNANLEATAVTKYIDSPEYYDFLQNIAHGSSIGEGDTNLLDDDPNEDPDFILDEIAELDEFDPEELRADRTTNIPRRELEGLLTDMFLPDSLAMITNIPEAVEGRSSKLNKEDPKRKEKEGFQESDDAPSKDTELNKQDSVTEEKEEGIICVKEPEGSCPIFPIGTPLSLTDYEQSLLRSQLEQHTQLLTQLFVGTLVEPCLKAVNDSCVEMLRELVEDFQRETNSRLGHSSFFFVRNLPAATKTCRDAVNDLSEKAENVVPSCPIQAMAFIVPLPHPFTRQVLSKSTALLYPSLAPAAAYCKKFSASDIQFSDNERMLLCMGLLQFRDVPLQAPRSFKPGRYEVVARHTLGTCIPASVIRSRLNYMRKHANRFEPFLAVMNGKSRISPKPLHRLVHGVPMKLWPSIFRPEWYNIPQSASSAIRLLPSLNNSAPTIRSLPIAFLTDNVTSDADVEVMTSTSPEKPISGTRREEGELSNSSSEGLAYGSTSSEALNSKKKKSDCQESGKLREEGEIRSCMGSSLALEEGETRSCMGSSPAQECSSRRKQCNPKKFVARKAKKKREAKRERKSEGKRGSKESIASLAEAPAVEQADFAHLPVEVPSLSWSMSTSCRGQNSLRQQNQRTPPRDAEDSVTGSRQPRTPGCRSPSPNSLAHLDALLLLSPQSPCQNSLHSRVNRHGFMPRTPASDSNGCLTRSSSFLSTQHVSPNFADINDVFLLEEEEVPGGKGAAHTRALFEAAEMCLLEEECAEAATDHDEEGEELWDEPASEAHFHLHEAASETNFHLHEQSSETHFHLHDPASETHFPLPVAVPETEEDTTPAHGKTAEMEPRAKRRTREEKERLGVEAMLDENLRRGIRNQLARRVAADIPKRMNMHSATLDALRLVLAEAQGNSQEALAELEKLLGESHQEVLCLLSCLSDDSSLPVSLARSPLRQAYADAFDLIISISLYAAATKMKPSARFLFRSIVDITGQGVEEDAAFLERVHNLFRNERPLWKMIRILLPSLPYLEEPSDSQFECIDLREADACLTLVEENSHIETVDLESALGAAPIRRGRGVAKANAQDCPSALLVNDGLLFALDACGKYQPVTARCVDRIKADGTRCSPPTSASTVHASGTKKLEDATVDSAKETNHSTRKRNIQTSPPRKSTKTKRIKPTGNGGISNSPLTQKGIFTREVDQTLLELFNEYDGVERRVIRETQRRHSSASSFFDKEELRARLHFLLSHFSPQK